MRKLTLALAATTALTLAASAATAQDWAPVNDRQTRLDQRIDAGVRSGQLTRDEAAQLEADFNAIEDLEMRYRVGGLSTWEREDLDRRLDALESRLRDESADNQDRGDRYGRDDEWRDADGGSDSTDRRGQWVSIDQRKMQLERRIENGRRTGQLTAYDVRRLRANFEEIARLEYRYRRNGLSQWERQDLNLRFDRLAAQIRNERRDYGLNR